MWCENEIEYILEHLQDPERLMDGEFVEWLEKKEHLALFEKIRNQREAFLRLQQEGNIDINVEFHPERVCGEKVVGLLWLLAWF